MNVRCVKATKRKGKKGGRRVGTSTEQKANTHRIKQQLQVGDDAGYALKLGSNIASGGAAGALSLMFVYSLDYARTR